MIQTAHCSAPGREGQCSREGAGDAAEEAVAYGIPQCEAGKRRTGRRGMYLAVRGA